MAPQELWDILHRQPFQPFRVHLRDGRTYDIRFKELAIVMMNAFDIGIPVPGETEPLCDYVVSVLPEDVVQVEPLQSSLPPASS